METNQGNPDFRELCAELTNSINSYLFFVDAETTTAGERAERLNKAISTAVAALAEPQPPADGEVRELVRKLGSMAADAEAADFVSDAAVLDLAIKHLERLRPSRVVPPAEGEVGELVARLRAIGNDYGVRHSADCRRAADLLEQLAATVKQSLTVEPTDEELLGLDDLRDSWDAQADAFNGWEALGIDEIIWWAQQQALARWGRPAPQPIPVSERLPGPEDCDAEGRCWAGTKAMVDTSGDRDVDLPPSWELREVCAQDDAWLPAHALPVPAAEVK